MSHPVNDMIADEAIQIFDSMSEDDQLEAMRGWRWDFKSSKNPKYQRECFAINKIYEELIERPGPHG